MNNIAGITLETCFTEPFRQSWPMDSREFEWFLRDRGIQVRAGELVQLALIGALQPVGLGRSDLFVADNGRFTSQTLPDGRILLADHGYEFEAADVKLGGAPDPLPTMF